MKKAIPLAALTVLTLTACGAQAAPPSTGYSVPSYPGALRSDARGPLVFPTKLVFKSPNANPQKLYVGTGVGAHGENCTSDNVITLSNPKIGKYHLDVYKVTPHGGGKCTIDFYKKNKNVYTRVHVTVRG